MKFQTSARYSAPVEVTRELLTDPQFAAFRLAKAGMEASSVESSEEGRGTRLVIVVPVSSEMVPQNYRRFVPSSITATITELWHPVAGDRSPTGVMTVEFTGVPAHARADFRLIASGETSERIFDGEVTVSIPLVGRAIEQKAVGMLERLVAAESAAASEYLARS